MAVTNFTPLLGLALPTTGDLSGTWGTTVNDGITDLLDDAVAGTTTLSADTDVTLSTTNGADNQARSAVILWITSSTLSASRLSVSSSFRHCGSAPLRCNAASTWVTKSGAMNWCALTLTASVSCRVGSRAAQRAS